MSGYATGFAEGEREAFIDRRHGVHRTRPNFPCGDRERGFWDAYAPRSPTWYRPPPVVYQWQQRRDLETA